jgi:hypothetical protein
MITNFSPVRINPWRETAILMVILMEVCWITPWFRSLTPETYAVSSSRILMYFFSVVLFSHLLVRLMDHLRLKRSIRQGLMITFLIIGSFIGIKILLYAHETISLSELVSRPIRSFSDFKYLIPEEFFVIIAIMIGFWRGVSLAQQSIGPSLVKSHFWLGIIMFVVFVFLITLATSEDPGEYFYLFLFASLVGVSTARISVIGMVRGGNENRFNYLWFIGILLSSFIVVGLSLLFGELLADKFGWIGGLLAGIFGSILIILWVILNPVLSILITFLNKIFNDSQVIKELGDSLENLNNLMRGFGQRVSDLMEKTGIGSMISNWIPVLKTIFLVGTILLIIAGIVIWMSIKLWKDREHQRLGDEKKSKIHTGNLIQNLLDILIQGWENTLNSFEQLTDLKKRQRIRAAARIRQIYTDLMDLCDSLGQPRLKAQTPLEYVPALVKLFPDLQLEISKITNAYMDVRYGLLPENPREIADIEDAWKRLHTSGSLLLKEGKHK